MRYCTLDRALQLLHGRSVSVTHSSGGSASAAGEPTSRKHAGVAWRRPHRRRATRNAAFPSWMTTPSSVSPAAVVSVTTSRTTASPSSDTSLSPLSPSHSSASPTMTRIHCPGRGVVKTLELVVLGDGAGSRRVTVGEEGEVGDEGGVGVGGAAGGVSWSGGGGGGGGAGGGEEEGSNHGDAGREVERQELALVEELIGGAEGGGGFARGNGDGELEV
ncbi:putative membrane-associated kinase regulator 1 [Senna tora]|uniref:Putative membrane-associated kinase regulator 1 n=1 Tax=Senna tora TaxID=362788 RepID=A0A834X452_9FABA|nr:putative membrane-associated kinase regulator 1 [Senna tora]